MRVVTTWAGKALPLTGGTLTGDLTMSGADIVLGANKITLTDIIIKRYLAARLGIRNITDTGFAHVDLGNIYMIGSLAIDSSGAAINAKNTAAAYATLGARGATTLEEIARLVGHATNPHLQATLPMVLKPFTGDLPAIEGMFGYDGDDDRLKYRDGAATQTIQPHYVKVGTFTNDTANGDQAVTGVGFQPDFLLIFNSTTHSIMVYDGTRQVAAIYLDGSWQHSSTVTLQAYTDGSNHIDGVMKSLDSDGFTITWSGLAGTAPAETFAYAAFKA